MAGQNIFPVTRRRWPSAGRHSLAVLLATTALGVVSAHAADSTWNGPGTDWNTGANWTPTSVPDGTATFTNNGAPANPDNASGLVTIGAVQFLAGAPSYTVGVANTFIVTGTGFSNNSVNAQTFNVSDSLIFQNGSSANGGPGVLNINSTGFVYFQNSSTAGASTITNGLVLQFFDNSTAGSAHITNTSTMDFFDASSAASSTITNSGTLTFNTSASAGSATITNSSSLQFTGSSTAAAANITAANNSAITFGNTSTAGSAQIHTTGTGAAVTFNDTSSAGNATFTANASTFGTITFNNTSTASTAHIDLVDTNLVFNNSSTAGTSLITMSNLMHPGNITFNDTSSAGNASIINVAVTTLGTSVQFLGASTAGNANITNNPNGAVPGQKGGVLNFGTLGGTDTANAGAAQITNSQFGSTSFLARTSASGATLVNNNGGSTNFQDQSTAGNANIINHNGGTTTFGVPVVGTDTASAGTAHIINNAGGTTEFTAATTAANSTINNQTGGFLQFGDSGIGNSTATAANATITNGGNASFNAQTTAGSAFFTTTSGGNVFFFDTSTGGNAQFVTNGGGTFDMSGLTSAGMTAGSIAGAGNYILGAKNLAVGGNNLSTEVSGVISGVGGSLTKVGTGTMILSGTNTYTGNTTISAGTLQLGNGGTTGSVAGNIVDNAILAVNRSNAITIGGAISGSGAFRQIGTGTTTLTNTNTYAGPTTVTAGTLAISAAGSITSNVTNNATFNNAGTVTGSVTNTGTANNTGTITNGLTNTGTFNAAGVVNGPIANNAGSFTVTGALSSNGSFTNAAGATLAVGTATYTLQGLLTNSGAVTVANGATLNATTGGITNNAGGTITVAAGGTVKDDLNNAGVTTNNGAYLANVATNTGSITNNGVWTGNVASNAGTINNNLTWTGTVSNAGTFNNNAGATVSGLLTNTAGTTTDNGALNGGANITGGTFTGSGTVTNLTVAGGTFAPGNGTPGSSMTVTGNLAFQSGAIYLVTLNPATTAFTQVGGTATFGGATVQAVFQPGSYIDKQYTIVNATGGVNGAFNPTVISNNSNLVTTLSYDAKDAFLNIKLKFVSPAGLNVNQQNVANALTNFFNTTGSIPAAFASLNAAGLTVASGELGTGVIQSSIKADDLFLNLLLDPTVAGRAGGFAAPGSASQFAAGDQAAAYAEKRLATPTERAAYAMVTKAPLLSAQPINRWSVWSAAYGGSAKVDGNAFVGSQDTTSRVWGVVGGADYKVTPDTLIGFALAGGGTNYSLANALGNGSADVFQAGAFGRHNFGPAYLSAALAYGWHDVTTNRIVTLAGFDQLQGRFRAETFSARFEGGYRFATPVVGITPYVAAQAISFRLPAYAEAAVIGTPLFALNYAGQTTTATRTELGLRTDKSFAMQDAMLTLRGRAAWAHDYNPDRAVTALFQALPGASFVVNGARGDPDAALVSAGAEIKWLNGFSLAATFEGEFSGNTTSYAGKGVAKYSW